MEIYIVQQGDDVDLIANKYGISVERLISDNGLINPYTLVVGQTLVILFPKTTYTVKQGDTLNAIATSNGISLMQLMRNNPFLYDREFIYPDESLVISFHTVQDIQVNGYTYMNLNLDILSRSLPYITYLSIYNYRIAEQANIINYGEDGEIIRFCKEYATVPLLMISTISPSGQTNIEFEYELLLVNELQDKARDDMLQIIRSKGYMGINYIVSNISVYNQHLYINFFSKLSTALRAEGYIFMVTISPYSTSTIINLDYQSISSLVDRIIFLENIKGKSEKPPSPITNISATRPFIEHVTNKVSSEYISLGKPVVGYDWELPFVVNKTVAKLMSLNSTITLAYEEKVVIQFDDVSQTPFYNYLRSNGEGDPENHIVWFIDARSIRALDDIIIDYKLIGSGLWYLTSYNQQLYSMTNALFNITKFN